jgi:hypothetical protein
MMLRKGQLSGRNDFDPNPAAIPILSMIGHSTLMRLTPLTALRPSPLTKRLPDNQGSGRKRILPQIQPRYGLFSSNQANHLLRERDRPVFVDVCSIQSEFSHLPEFFYPGDRPC